MSRAPLNVLSDDVHILKPSLNGTDCKYRTGTAQAIGNVNHLGGHADGMGTGKTKLNSFLVA
jgi:hypothetical protein